MSTVDFKWIRNPKGVVSQVPVKFFDKFIKLHGWSEATPEDVPKEKVYTMDGDLTEDGERRRKALVERSSRKKVAAPAPEPESEPKITIDTLSSDAPVSKFKDGKTLTREEYRQLAWPDLKSYASTCGIDIMQRGLTRDGLIGLLDKSTPA